MGEAMRPNFGAIKENTMPTAKPPTAPTPERLSSSVVSVVEGGAVISRAGGGNKVPATDVQPQSVEADHPVATARVSHPDNLMHASSVNCDRRFAQDRSLVKRRLSDRRY